MILFWSSVAASLLAAIGCAYLITAAILVRRFAPHRTATAPAVASAVTILKPLHGDEPGLFDNLRSFCIQDYGGDIQIVFGVQDPGDGAIAIVEQLRKLKLDCDLDLVVDPQAHGLNRKVSNLVNMAPRIRHGVVVLADSDMRVDPGYLARVIAGLGLDLARPCFGSTMALRREALAAIGGFKPFADCLADDYAMGAALRAHGYDIAIPPFALAHICTQTSFRDLWRHQLRWARTIRSIDPAGYAGSLLSHPFAWALVAVLLGAGSTAALPAGAIVIAAIACRMTLVRQVERVYALPPQPYWLVPACDLLSFAVFVISFVNWEVSWRGRRFRMAAGAWTADGETHS